MAASGFTPISLYYSTTAAATPSSSNLVDGELAINIADGKLFYKDIGGVVQEISAGGGGSSPATPTVAGVVFGRTNGFSGSPSCATALGQCAGGACQAGYSVAIGSYATANHIFSNAIGPYVSTTGSGQTHIGSIRNATNAKALFYNTCTKEITYSCAGGGGSSPATPTVAGVVFGRTNGFSGSPGCATALGQCAGGACQAGYSVAIGSYATANSMFSNAIGPYVSTTGFGQTHIGSIRNATGTTYLGYDASTREVTHSSGAPSDINLKENIQAIGCALNKTAQIRGVTFNWKKCGAPSVGVIAQELEQVFPEMVTLEGDGYKTVKYDNMVAVLVEAVKELKARIESLENQLN